MHIITKKFVIVQKISIIPYFVLLNLYVCNIEVLFVDYSLSPLWGNRALLYFHYFIFYLKHLISKSELQITTFVNIRDWNGDGVTGDGGYGEVTGDKIFTGDITSDKIVTGEAFSPVKLT